MAKWKCNSCAETEGGDCPCTFENPMVNNMPEEEILCPITGDTAEFEIVKE
jgi:hypothetical protein